MENYDNMLTLENHLASFRDRGEIYRELYNNWLVEKRDIANVLKNIVLCFPHYSLHDASHSDTVLMRMEQLLGEKRIAQIGATETWLLLMSAYTHDLGMLIQEDELVKIWDSEPFQSYLKKIDDSSDLKEYARIVRKKDFEKRSKNWPVQVKWAVTVLSADYFRRSHAQRSSDLIRNQLEGISPFKLNLSANGFIQERFIYLLSKFAELHGAPFDDVLKLDKVASGMGGSDDLIYPRRVAALLRLADLLDMDNGRFDENAYPINGKVPETTRAHQRKHSSLRHFLVIPERIEIELDCPDENSFQAASSWVGWIKDEIREISEHWTNIMPDNYGSAPILENPRIFLNGQKLEGDTLASFKVDNDSIFEVFEGANIYKNRFSCIRELIQNALDATKLRFWNLLQHHDICDSLELENIDKITPYDIPFADYNRFPITVEVIYNQEKEERNSYIEIFVKDHGTGITDKRLKQMMKIGQSEHILKSNLTVDTMPKWLQPTGAFGLGLQSVFQVTDKLECETQPERENGKKVTFRSHRDSGRISYINLEDDSKLPVGTTFHFCISSENMQIQKFNLGGNFDSHYMELDPFSTDFKNEKEALVLFYIIDCLDDEIGNPIFPIQVSYYFKTEKGRRKICERNYGILNNSALQKEQEESDIVYYRGKDKSWFNAYDITNNISFTIRDDLSGKRRKGIALTFKGMSVDSHYLTASNFYLDKLYGCIDFLGFPTREYLSLNRAEIRRNKKQETFNIVYKDIKCILEYKIKEIIENKRSELSSGEASFYALFLPLIEDFKAEKGKMISSLEKILLPLIKTEQILFTRENERWNEKAELLSKSLKMIWNKDVFYVYSAERTWNGSMVKPPLKIIDKLYNQMNQDSEPKRICIYPQNAIQSWLNVGDVKVLEIASDGKEPNEVKLQRCVFEGNEKILPELDTHTTEEILQISLQQSRIVTIACNAYPHLALDREKDLTTLYYIHRYFNSWFDVGRNTFAWVVSPFSKEDIEKLKQETVDFGKFWNQIKEREDFQNLVDYVYEHRLDDKGTKEDIIKDYKKWVQEAVCMSNKGHENK
ncbi:ATP-binding protein [Acidaminococcus timonensis]|uniref:ATP-binding protein n=1 Tax=Acidaminococcus timonensis TaxID=1871002 RepID=UPI0009F26B09|nr:ATP-binding protein [Acidaminococcus timonensis]